MLDSGARTSRLAGVDVARALALLSMLDAHAFDGWVAVSARASMGFGLTRALATLALPAFLLLAGVSLALRAAAHAASGRPVRELRTALSRRGLGLFAGGYAFSLACAVLDGGLRADTLLRADVLHAIGLSLALIAWLGLSPAEPDAGVDTRTLARRSAWLAVVLVSSCPWLSRLGASTTGVLRYALASLIDVPGVTRMALVPLGCFVAMGVPLGSWLAAKAGHARPSELSVRALLPLGALASVLGWTAQSLLAKVGIVAAHTNLAIVSNIVDLFGRALLVLALGLWLAPRLPARLHAVAVALGRRSLLIYVLHLPLCYGRLARPIAHRLSMAPATFAFALLVIACCALAWIVESPRPRI